MENNKLRDLIIRARGDRTKKKYAEESGVNVAIISRIESGDYMPGKNVLKRLTSINAKPQGGITFSDLLEAANDSKQYQKGMDAGKLAYKLGMSSIPVLASIVSGCAMTKSLDTVLQQGVIVDEKSVKKKTDDVFFDEVNELAIGMERYKATATGVILSKLAQKGIRCSLGKQEDTDFLLNYTDTILLVDENEINNWVLSCFTLNEENKKMVAFIKPFAARFVEKLLHTKPDSRKKASFVVDSDELYEYLLEIKGKNSYRGNLSIIQFDATKMKIVREEYLAYFDLNVADEKLLVIDEKRGDSENDKS